MRYNHVMDALHISALGPPQISLNGQGVGIRRRKAVALLVYLAVEGQSQSREFLSGLFWPEFEQSKAYAYLRRTLWEIKHVLGEGWLEADREHVGIPDAANLQTDLVEFHTLLRGDKDHDHPFAEPCDQCIERLEAAIHLYRGDFLSGFSLSACTQFDDWQFLQSEITRRRFRDGLENLVNALEKRGRISEAIAYAQRWLAIDNLDEAVHRKLMALYAQNDQIHAALRQFEHCRSVFKTELDLAPEVETTNLYHQIRERRFSSSPVEAGRTHILLARDNASSWLEQILASPVQVAYRTNLPRQRTPFIGRNAEIADISRSLHNPDCWLLTLTGMGGIGKTLLAHQVGREIGAGFPHGVYFVPLTGMESISALVPKVAETLGLPLPQQEGSLATQLNAYLRDKTLLLILDGFDAFTAEAAILHQLHAAAAGLKFLATSRERLKISGEWVFEVQGLDYPESDRGKLDDILAFHAVELFLHAAGRTRSGFQIDEDNHRDVVAITQCVEGMPLALEMAASWINLLSPREILAEIRANLDFLKTDLQDTPARQRSMRAVLDYSWSRLDRDDRAALARLSVFQGIFTREAAEKVAGVSLSDLKRFLDRSFIRQTGSGGFNFHALQHQYALEELRGSPGKFRSTNDRHAAYYCVAVSQWGEGLKGTDQVQILPIMQRESGNIRAAWAWVTRGKQIEQIVRGFDGLCYFYLRTLRDQEGLDACQLALNALVESAAECRPEIQANLLAWKSLFCLNLGDDETAAEAIDASLKLIVGIEGKRDGLEPLWAWLYLVKGIVENYLGNRENTIENYDRAFSMYSRLEDYSGFSYLMLRALDTDGIYLEKTYQYLGEAVRFKRKAGDLFNSAYLLHMTCMIVAYHLGQPVRAEALMQEACGNFEQLGDPFSREMSLVTADPVLNTTGRYAELFEVREKKLAFARERGDRRTSGNYLAEVAECLCHLGHYASAGDSYGEALSHVKGGTLYQYAYRLCGLGEVLLVQDQIAESHDVFQESIHGMKIGEKWGQGKALAGLSVATFKMGDREKAWEIIQQALQYHCESHTHYFAHFSLAAYAYLLSQHHNSLTAIEIFAMLEQQKFVRASQWFNDVYRKPIYAVATKDNPDEIATAESIAKECNLWRTLEQILQQAEM
jgi:DNA-binding SARP family transcriptional activator/predicted ATPase